LRSDTSAHERLRCAGAMEPEMARCVDLPAVMMTETIATGDIR
jgi:hypothetical protein